MLVYARVTPQKFFKWKFFPLSLKRTPQNEWTWIYVIVLPSSLEWLGRCTTLMMTETCWSTSRAMPCSILTQQLLPRWRGIHCCRFWLFDCKWYWVAVASLMIYVSSGCYSSTTLDASNVNSLSIYLLKQTLSSNLVATQSKMRIEINTSSKIK